VNNTFLLKIKAWFIGYTKSFLISDNDFNANITMKKIHTLKVSEEIKELCESVNSDEPLTNIAQIAALLHDVGRFEQYKQYKTFVDSRSVNHAELGVEVINDEGVLKTLDWNSRQLVINAVKYHNQLSVVDGLDDETTQVLKMLRDADKIDIWRVVSEYYNNNENRNKAIELNLPDIEKISDGVLGDILSESLVKSVHLKTLNDFKALQMGWVFDLNYKHTYEVLKNRKYLEKIRDAITVSDIAQTIYKVTSEYLEKKIAN